MSPEPVENLLHAEEIGLSVEFHFGTGTMVLNNPVVGREQSDLGWAFD